MACRHIAMDLYERFPIEPISEMRLVILQSESPRAAQGIVCDLQTASLTDAPQYEAL